ncbi:MAG: DNA methylase, partial [Actinomycetota bacterium]|nr:DNA methylase [Actinomycetota bacterium]
WDVAVDKEAGKVRDQFACPHCSALLKKKGLARAWNTRYDESLADTVRQARQVPVMINYSAGGKRFEKMPDDFDRALISIVDESPMSYWFPTDALPDGYNTRQPMESHGITHAHHFYSKRTLLSMGFAVERLNGPPLFLVTAIIRTLTKMFRWAPRGKHTAGTSGILYIPSVTHEYPLTGAIARRRRLYRELLEMRRALSNDAAITTGSLSNLTTLSNSVDYIFTDPPFGGNLMYSELNFLWESWLKVFTNNAPEAIENKVQGKGLLEYQEIMTHCFQESHRVLKPGRWMTVEFHNSKNSVWNAIQESLQRAGFVVADVRTLDKKQGTLKQTTSAAAVKQDLVISAYKPNEELERRFELEAGTEGGVWDYIETHLDQLAPPIVVGGEMEINQERMKHLLFDRMVAFHVQRGVSVPLSSAEFYAGLEQRYAERDGMYFVPHKVTEYDRKRMTVSQVMEPTLFVSDEKSAIDWLSRELKKKPRTFQELHPSFTKESSGWAKHEKSLELADLLKENFLRHKGGEPIPHQILSWMKQSAKHRPKIAAAEEKPGGIPEIGLTTHDPEMISVTKDRWYVPDPSRARDLEKLREASLYKEFETYRQAGGKKLKVFRLEAVRAGFGKAWRDKDYATIIEVAKKIPEAVLQEDPKLLMYYDNALDRTGEA